MLSHSGTDEPRRKSFGARATATDSHVYGANLLAVHEELCRHERKKIAMSTTTKNAQSSSSAVLVQEPGLDGARLGRALEACALPSSAAPGLSADVIDGALERAAGRRRVRQALGVPSDRRISDEVIDELFAGASTEEEIFGPGGVFAGLTKRLVERAMEVELSDHVGYEPHCEPPGGAANQRNGTTPKTLITDHGKVPINAPRDRDGSFEPQIVRKRQRRFQGFDEKILALYSPARRSRPRAASLTRTPPACAAFIPDLRGFR